LKKENERGISGERMVGKNERKTGRKEWMNKWWGK
jgi:hypothetical protein